MKNNNKVKKIISSLFLLLIIVPTVLFSRPKKTDAQTDAAVDSPIDSVMFTATTTAAGIAAAAEVACGVSAFGFSDFGCPIAALNTYLLAAQTAEVVASDTKSAAKNAIAGPSADGWLTQAYHMITAPSSVSTAVSSNASLGMKITALGKEVLRQAIIAFEHQLISTMTQSTVKWINSGFHGSPLFVQNPSLFFGNIAKTEIKTLVNEFGYDPNRFPFGKAFALNTINAYKRTADNDAAYSLSAVIRDPVLLNNYRNNFNTGGWNGFLINTQYPQNNYLGFQMIATNQLARQLQGTTQNAAQKVQTALNQGMGFLSPTTCPSNIPNAAAYNAKMINEFNPPSFNPSAADAEAKKTLGAGPDCSTLWTQSNACDAASASGADRSKMDCNSVYENLGLCTDAEQTYMANFDKQTAAAKADFNSNTGCVDANGKSALVATTPGAVVSNQIMSALDSNGRLGELDAALGNSMSAILNALMNHFMQEGLSGIAGAVQSMPSVDNWSYNGQTLSGSGGSTISTNPLIVPTNVSLNAGDVTSGAISGGTVPYSVTTQPDKTIATAKIGADGASLSITGISQGTTSVTIQDSSSTNKVATAIPVAQVSTITIGGSIGTAGTLSATINSIVTSILVTSNDTTISAATSLTNAINANSKINKTVLATNTTPRTITLTSQTAGTAGVFSLTSTNTTTALTATSATLTFASDGNIAQNQNATVTITVGTNGNILLNFANISKNPANISASVGTSMNLTMSSGTQPYNIQTEPNSTIALALINDNTLMIVGVAPGATSITLQDSSGININLNITVGNETPLAVSPKSVSTNVSGTGTATISGGTPPYTITVPATGAMATVSGNTLTVTGSGQGTTSVTIQDSYSPAETITVPINIGASPVIAPLTTPTTSTNNSTTTSSNSTMGTCTLGSMTVNNVPQAACTGFGGTNWIVNP
jgi:hypothetical protein